MSFLTCRCDLPQNEQRSCSFESVGRAIVVSYSSAGFVPSRGRLHAARNSFRTPPCRVPPLRSVRSRVRWTRVPKVLARGIAASIVLAALASACPALGGDPVPVRYQGALEYGGTISFSVVKKNPK